MAVDNKNREVQNLERYGVWVKTGPDTGNRHEYGSLDLMDIEDSEQDGLLITEEEEKLLGELEESSLPDFGEFDDVFQDSFDEDFEEKPSGLPDESTGMLHKIENEISLLRNEIRQLKDEITGLRLPSVSRQTADSTDSGGFFDHEEEDETIALTGDELDNILDSADMTEESYEGDSADSADMDSAAVTKLDSRPAPDAGNELDDLSIFDDENELDDLSFDDDETESFDSGFEDDIEETISFDDEETIDLSGDFTEVGLEVDDEFDSAVDLDPAMAILGSPDEPIDSGDPETIEMYIAGPDKAEVPFESEHEDNSIVNIDDISGGDGFEDVTDLENFGIDDIAVDEMPLMDDTADLIMESGDFFEDDDQAVSDVFDEGEEVDIDLTDFDENLDSVNETEVSGIKIEDISLEEFGMLEDEDSDVLSEMIESPADSDEGDFEAVVDINLEEVLADGIEDEERSLVSGKNDFDDEVALEELDSGDDLIIDENDFRDDYSKTGSESDESDDFDELTEIDEPDLILEAEGEDDSPFVSPRPSAKKSLDDLPEIRLDEALGEIESADEFSLDEDEVLEDLEIEFDDEPDGVKVTLPDDDFNELPGTEDVDLNSLEALAAAPDLTEDEIDDFIELPEIDLGETKGPDLTSSEFREKSKTALELSSLPIDLKDEIKEVLIFMDDLLLSLPEEKIQEFARSEHWEVYKRIFDELGIPEDGSA